MSVSYINKYYLFYFFWDFSLIVVDSTHSLQLHQIALDSHKSYIIITYVLLAKHKYATANIELP